MSCINSGNEIFSEHAVDVVGKVLDAMEEHFLQPIHVTTLISDDHQPSESERGNDKIPPIVLHLLECLQREAKDDCQALLSVTIMMELVQMYPSRIRPRYFVEHKLTLDGIPLLTSYEQLVGLFSRKFEKTSKAAAAATDDFFTDVPRAEQELVSRRLSQALCSVASDITRATAPIHEGPLLTIRPRIVMPTLSRLLHTMLCFGCSCSIPIQSETLERCVTTLLAFGVSRFSPEQLDGSIPDHLSDLSQYCVLYPPLLDQCSISKMKFDSLVLDGTSWDDDSGSSGVAARLANQIWKLLLVQVQYPESTGTNRITTADAVPTVDQCIQQRVIERLGVFDLAKRVRAHFYGRDGTDEQKSRQLTKLFLGKTITYQLKSETSEKAYETIPSRLHVALHFISRLDELTQPVMEELLPICYELLSASNDSVVAMGAAALFHLLQCKQNSADLWTTVADNLLQLFDMVAKTCRVGPALAVIGLAQWHLFLKLDSSYDKKRLSTLQQWLIILDRNRHRTTDPLVHGLLVGIILPLLYDHASSGKLCIQVGRLGLSALLPLLRDDAPVHVQIASILALTNLLVAAYPIMPRHGGKIMCELVACIARIRTQTDDDNDQATPPPIVVEKLAQHAAAIALVICGERAREIIDKVAEDPSYTDLLKQTVADVLEQSKTLQATRNVACA